VSAGARNGRGGGRSPLATLLEVLVIVAVAIGLAVAIQAFLVKPYKIPSGSMEPTLQIGQRVLVNRIGETLGGPHVGEIAVFHPPVGAEHELCGPVAHTVHFGHEACDHPVPDQDTGVNFIKRIVAGPGETISIVEGHAIRDGVREKDSYIRPCAEPQSPACNFPDTIRIPAGHWFMMGDNRGESDDSRFWGPVPTGWIIGQAFATYWPLDRIGTL
jgi:signal peptidase I